MQILEKLKIIPKKQEKKASFQAIILNTPTLKNSYSGQILGRTLADWVAFACNNINVKIIDFDGKTAILNVAKEHIDQSYDFTILLMSTTPLLTQDTIASIMEYCKIKDISLCKLPVGYVIKNDAFLNSKVDITVDSLYSQNLDEFMIVETKKQFTQAEDVLQDRINSFHIANGVEIKNIKTVYIEPEVDILKGVVIFGGNILKGQTTISHDVILKENNVIENSKIQENSCVSGSVISDSVISSNVYISSFCEIKNSLIEKDCSIGAGSKIYNYNVKMQSKIKSNTVLGESDDSNNWTR